MLVELSIKNFALIDKQILNFSGGLTVLTGETGAGKSIIIDAIGVLVGGRASAEFVRHGEEKAIIEGLFQFEEDDHPALIAAQSLDIEIEENALIVRRVLASNGKSSCRINGQLVRVSELKQIGLKMLDIHGQHEHQALMDATLHLSLLDQFIANEINDDLVEYREVYHRYLQIKQELNRYTTNDQLLAQKLDLLKFQVDEISKADLQIGEEEQLIEEKNQLNNFEKIQTGLQNAYTALSAEESGIATISAAMQEIRAIADYHEQYQAYAESLANAYYILEDTSYSLRRDLDSFEFDSKRLMIVEARLDEIQQLKRKYGSGIEQILAHLQASGLEIEAIENKESHLAELTNQFETQQAKVKEKAAHISQIRKHWAKTLEQQIEQQLQELYMEKAQFFVQFSDIAPTETGIDSIEFYIAANPGEPPKPLAKTASGGELSRIMLAIKTIFSHLQGVATIIFDEIDSGVSGRVAQAIAEKIYRISLNAQVLCISHLPHVASMADTHLFIAKEQNQDHTATKVFALSEPERIIEIGKMISGQDVNAHTEEHVKQMFYQADQIKHKLQSLQ